MNSIFIMLGRHRNSDRPHPFKGKEKESSQGGGISHFSAEDTFSVTAVPLWRDGNGQAKGGKRIK